MMIARPRPLPLIASFVLGVVAVLAIALATARAAETPPPAVPVAISTGSGSALIDAVPVAAPLAINTEDPGGLARGIYDAALAGKYKIGVGFLLMLAVFGLRSKFVLGRVAWFKTRLGGVTIAAVTSVGAVLGLALAAGAPIQVGVILNALGTALTAAGAWEWARDTLTPKAATA